MLTIDLTERCAVITGGSSGIGLATAELFLRAGARVAICGRDAARLRAAEQALHEKHPAARLLAAPCDVLQADEVAAFAAQVAGQFGGVDMLVNNAGQGRVSTFASTTDAAWHDELQLKLFSLIHPTRAFLPWLQKSEQAAIVCVNSLLAVQPEPHMVATSAARAGAHSLVHSMAMEFAPLGVRVNAVLIGLVESGQWQRRFEARDNRDQDWPAFCAELAARKGIPLRRLGRPEEAAQAIFHLATPLSSYTTGSALDVSGGQARFI